jgi:soluble lytic murein transglycosylase-like protein
MVLVAWGALAEDKVATGDKIAGTAKGEASDRVAGDTRSDSGDKAAGAKPGAGMGESLAKQRAAMAVQRETARKQAELLKLEPLVHHEMEPAEAECDPIEDAAVKPVIESAAKANELQPDLLRAVMRQESQFYPCAVSEKGAEGLMQLMPSTAQQFAVQDVFDPKQNVEAGAKYLKQLFDKYKGDLSLALAAYNAGPAAVDQAKGMPEIPETRNYVEAILKSLVKKTDAGAPPP